MKRVKWTAGLVFAFLFLTAGYVPGTPAVSAERVSVVEMQVKDYEMKIRKADEEIRFEKGITLAGKSLEGMTVGEARAWAEAYVQARKDRAISLTVCPENVFYYNGVSFAVTWTNPEALAQLSDYVTGGNFVEQYKLQKDLQRNPVDISIDLEIDGDLLREEVGKLIGRFETEGANASVRRENGSFIISPEITGKTYDAEAIYEELYKRITDFSSTELVEYEFPYEESGTQYTAADFDFSPVPLGSYTTGNLGGEARVANIRKSAGTIDGVVVYPGQEISALGLYGPQTVENGYQMAPGYNQGKQVMVAGGGVCQTTTTFYNALLRAELEITERHPHSMIVLYVPPALDAAVASGVKDLKFCNNLSHPIYLEAYVSGDQLTVNIWGVEERPANRTVEYYHVVDYCAFPDPLYQVVVNDSVATVGRGVPLEQKAIADVESHPAVRARSFKRVYVDGELVEETPLNTDAYSPMVGLLYIASDVSISNSAFPSSDPKAVYRYLGWDIYHEIYTK